jgi:hypothetical protein
MRFKNNNKAAPTLKGRLPELPDKHQELWQRTVWANLLQALRIKSSMLNDEITDENQFLSERERTRLEEANWWLSKYIPNPKPEEQLNQTPTYGLSPQVVQLLMRPLSELVELEPKKPLIQAKETPAPQPPVQASNVLSVQTLNLLVTSISSDDCSKSKP